VAEALDQAFERVRADGLTMEVEADAARFVIFSDQHKGARNGADDFQLCERAYNAALAYYYEFNYHLVELGDVEELWEERAPAVLRTYAHSTELAARFHKAGRYLRVWGNHDDHWSSAASVRRNLGPVFGETLVVHEGVRVILNRGGEMLGELFLVHGHQGTKMSDRWTRLARIPVRVVWRPLQRLFKVSLNTPAKDWDLRERHNLALYSWAAERQGLVLIAGHTHRPVFLSRTLAARLQEELALAREQAAADPGNPSLVAAVARLSARLEWARAQDGSEPGREGEASAAVRRPCYFNSGCCSFMDGDITGLEIADGMIRLVRWPDDHDHPAGQVLAELSLDKVFARL
jgi:hypothetical protein